MPLRFQRLCHTQPKKVVGVVGFEPTRLFRSARSKRAASSNSSHTPKNHCTPMQWQNRYPCKIPILKWSYHGDLRPAVNLTKVAHRCLCFGSIFVVGFTPFTAATGCVLVAALISIRPKTFISSILVGLNWWAVRVTLPVLKLKRLEHHY